MGPYIKTTTYPPLGQLTLIPSQQQQVSFTVVLELVGWNFDFPLEVFLCYTSGGAVKHPSTWDNIPLTIDDKPFILDQGDNNRWTFTGNIAKHSLQAYPRRPGFSSIAFTIRYRSDPYCPWQWVHTSQGSSPGELILQMTLDPSTVDLATILELDSTWKVDNIPTSSPKASVFHLQTLMTIPQSVEEEQLQLQILGKIKDQAYYAAMARLEPFWLGPRQGREYFYVAEDTVLCSFLTTRGQICTLLAFSGFDDTYTVFRSNEAGDVVVAARSDGDAEIPFSIFAAVASTFEDSVAAVMEEARRVVNESPRMKKLAEAAGNIAQTEENKLSTEKWFDGLAYCTWNGLGQDLTQQKILTALKNLANNKINISTLLIDDNWQSLGPTLYDYNNPILRGWDKFEANKDACPGGLKELVSLIRSQHPNIHDVGVWHALMGYWGGLAVHGKLANTYKTVQTESKMMLNIPSKVLSIAGSDLDLFYDDFYTYLASSGITFVKTDAQHMMGEFALRKDRLELVSSYQLAWTSAHLKHFNGKAISCMSHVPQILLHSLLQTHTPRIQHRNSDDFFPEIPSSHPWHLWVNSHNALFTQHLNVLPDWDMFQTSHKFSEYHAAARCLSGGPILITDVPGEHDVKLIEQMTAQDANGRSIALRPRLGKTISAFDNYVDGNMLKIGTTTEMGASVLGHFNISEKDVTCMTPIAEFPGLKDNAQYIVRSYRTGQMFGPFNISNINAATKPRDMIYLTVPVRGYEILTAYPVQSLPTQGLSVAVLGLIDKMTGCAALTSFSLKSNGAFASRMKAVGKFALWIQIPSKATVTVSISVQQAQQGKIEILPDAPDSSNGLLKASALQNNLGKEDEKSCLIEYDLVKAWEEFQNQGHESIDLELALHLQ